MTDAIFTCDSIVPLLCYKDCQGFFVKDAKFRFQIINFQIIRIKGNKILTVTSYSNTPFEVKPY